MGDEAVYDELFSYACPKFVTPQLPAYDDPMSNNSQDAYRLQLKMFLLEARRPRAGFLAALTWPTAPCCRRAAALRPSRGARVRCAPRRCCRCCGPS